MIRRLKEAIKRVWPPLRLRSILLAALILAASMPGFAAMVLRVYENALAQQTEVQLETASAALLAAWVPVGAAPFERAEPSINLSSADVLPAIVEGGRSRSMDPSAVADARRISPMLDRLAETMGASITLLDAAGAPLPDGGPNAAARPEVTMARAGEPQTLLRKSEDPYGADPISRAANVVLVHVRPVMRDGQLQGFILIEKAPRDVFAGMWADRWNIAIGAGAIFLLLLFLAGLLTRGIARPIEALSAATRDVAQRAVTIPPTSPLAAVEIQGLYESFATMADRIEQRSRYLRDFAMAISHEFKTPLTGIRGALELITEHGDSMSEAERGRFLSNAEADAERLTRLVGRLLDLARADMADPTSGQVTSAGPLLAQLAHQVSAPGFRVTAAGDAQLAISADALETIIETLVENSRQAGASQCDIGISREGRFALVGVVDNGAGVPPEDRDRIFEPFFTGRRESGGTGLGLSIVRSLLGTIGGSIRVVESDAGAAFVMRIPVHDAVR